MSDEVADESLPDAADDGLGDLTFAGGPWATTGAPADAEFLAFGALHLPALPRLKVRLEIDPDRREIGAVTVRIADCALQLQVIAKRPEQSQWTDIRQDLLANLRKRPGHQQVIEGRYGAEVIGVLTGRTHDGLLVDSTMRFQGIEGDTWMIRAVSSGPSVTHDDVVSRVDAFLSRCAVDDARFGEARPGEVVPLADPPGGMDASAHDQRPGESDGE